MSLDNIQLPPAAIRDLFSKTLVELDSGKAAAPATGAISILGKNRQGVLALVQHESAAFLPDDELDQLLKILSACKLSMDDAAVINLHRHPGLTCGELSSQLQPRVVLLFGAGPEAISLPLTFPRYQVQAHNGVTYLHSAPLSVLQQDKAEKTKLWHCLQQIFQLSKA